MIIQLIEDDYYKYDEDYFVGVLKTFFGVDCGTEFKSTDNIKSQTVSTNYNTYSSELLYGKIKRKQDDTFIQTTS